jgi:transaldolase
MLFVDSFDPAAVRAIWAWGVARGETTTPMLFARAGATDVDAQLADICAASEGPVSVQLLATEPGAMIAEAERYVAIAPSRVVIKVPMGETGLEITHRLARAGTRVNVTACMSSNQTYLASQAGASYVSIFAGRVRDMGYDPRPVIERTRTLLDRERTATEIIVGSVRTVTDVTDALDAGAHIVTVPVPILRKMASHPQTDATIRELRAAYDAHRDERG